MYNIAICDDIEKDLKTVKEYIKGSTEYEKDMNIWEFTSAIELIEAAKEHNMNLVILDMQMPSISGFEAASKLRELNTEMVIAFCSAECVPRPEHFRVQPYRYFMKRDPSENISATIKELLEEIKRIANSKNIEVTTDGRALILNVREILYMEKEKYGTQIILNTNSVLYKEGVSIHAREKLADIEKELQDEGFAKPHTSYLVNLRCVKAIDGLEVILENGERIPITKKIREQFYQEFSSFFSRKYRVGN